jgi:hypothetical protein
METVLITDKRTIFCLGARDETQFAEQKASMGKASASPE